MRAPEDVPIHYLVVDANGFIKNPPLIDLAAKIYSIQEVVDEIKDKETRQRLKALPFEIICTEPSPQSIKAVLDVSKKTGDYASLSLADLKVLALTLDLHIEHCGPEGVVYDVQPKAPIWEDTSKKNATEKAVKKMEKELANDEEGEEEPEVKGRQKIGFDSWVDESNLLDVVGRMESAVDPAVKKMKVACFTTDFPLQNVLLHMKLNLVSIDGMRINRLRTCILRCRICKKTTPDVWRTFCPNCGHEGLHKVGISVDKFGNQKIHINWERERVTRGYRFSLPTPKGGKHHRDLRVTEDHMMPQNRMAKVIQNPVSDAPFGMKDVTSRSALINANSFGHTHRKNPNELQGGRKRGGKRR